MSRTYHHGNRNIRVRGIRRESTDLRRLARALIDLAHAEAETQAEIEHQKQRQSNPKRRGANGKRKTNGADGGGA
jgi:hypothetical protein